MSNAEEKSVVPVDVANAATLTDLLHRVRESDVINIFENSAQGTIVIIRMQNFVREGKFDHQQTVVEDSPEGKIRKLSENPNLQYRNLLNYFNEWKPLRQDFIKILNESSRKLERNFKIESSTRIIASAADISATLLEYNAISGWPVTLLQYISLCSFPAYVIERCMRKFYICPGVKKALDKDQESFKKVTQWLKQTEELDKAVREFFPYGIDKDVMKRIHTFSNNTLKDDQELFISIVLSNVKKDTSILEDVGFFLKADCFATSEAGKTWFLKKLLEDDPSFTLGCNLSLSDKIQDFDKEMKSITEKLKNEKEGETESSALERLKVTFKGFEDKLKSAVKIKVLINSMAIFNILMKNEPEQIDDCRKLSIMASEELEKLENIVRLLNPTNPH